MDWRDSYDEPVFCSVTGSDGFRAYEHPPDEYCPVCVPIDGVPDITEPTHSYHPDETDTE